MPKSTRRGWSTPGVLHVAVQDSPSQDTTVASVENSSSSIVRLDECLVKVTPSGRSSEPSPTGQAMDIGSFSGTALLGMLVLDLPHMHWRVAEGAMLKPEMVSSSPPVMEAEPAITSSMSSPLRVYMEVGCQGACELTWEQTTGEHVTPVLDMSLKFSSPTSGASELSEATASTAPDAPMLVEKTLISSKRPSKLRPISKREYFASVTLSDTKESKSIITVRLSPSTMTTTVCQRPSRADMSSMGMLPFTSLPSRKVTSVLDISSLRSAEPESSRCQAMMTVLLSNSGPFSRYIHAVKVTPERVGVSVAVVSPSSLRATSE
mmetsp:Transcript_37685/g.118931  ORF Transcript_37685/g.118931 Transcript_37685/m.118931 type:complete len:321 (-) Transcript_37685:1691-2653(-)